MLLPTRKGIKIYTKRDKVSRNIASGVSHIRSFIENAENQRFLHIHNKCTGMMIDLENYRYPEAKEGKDLKDVIEEIKPYFKQVSVINSYNINFDYIIYF